MQESIVKRLIVVVTLTLVLSPWISADFAQAGRIDPGLEEAIMRAGPDQKIEVLIRVTGTLPGSALKRQLAAQFPTRAERHRAAVNTLTAISRTTQPGILRTLGEPYYKDRVSNVKSFWIDNVITAEMTPSAIAEIAGRSDVDQIYIMPAVELIAPAERPMVAGAADATATAAIQISAIKADALWALGYTGKGRLVGSLDTGVDGKHLLLSPKWRGHNGYSVRESWWNPQDQDTIPHIFPGGGPDRDNHGTWVMGLMVGLQDIPFAGFPTPDTLGPAFDAQWISAAAIDIEGANIIEALQWMADPDGDPNTETDVPDVVNNSWGASASGSGCSDVFWNAIDNVEAAGAVMLFAAGNEGASGPMSIRNPGNRITSETNAFSIGMVDARNPAFPIDSRSSRGPSICDSATIKPEIMAPGVALKSTHPNNNIALGMVGTSFATPLVAGGVALLREYNPNATPDQIKTALLESAVDLGVAGPDNNYGHGMLDLAAALEALPANDQPALYIKRDYYQRPAPGATSSMVIVLRSAGPAVTGVTVTLTSEDARLTVTDGSVAFGDFAAIGDTAGNFSAPFSFGVSADVLEGERLPVRFDISGSGGYARSVRGAIQVGPEQSDELFTHTGGNFRLTVSAFGMFGLHSEGVAPRFGGQGYLYDGDTATQSLFEGAFLVGTDALHVSDNARDLLQTPDFDFQVDPGGRLHVELSDSTETGIVEATRAAFSDALAENPIGLFIVQRTFVRNGQDEDDFLVVEYTIHNRSGSTISGLRPGLFFDWDFPWLSGSKDDGGFVATEGLGWMKHDTESSYRGLTVLTAPGATSYRYLDNPIEIYDGFSDAEKWGALSGGLEKLEPDPTNPGDGAHLIATGPFTLGPDDSVTVAFAIIGAYSEQELIASAQSARSLYSSGALTVLPGAMSFNAKEGGSNPSSESVTITNNTAVSVTYDLGHVPSWATVMPATGTITSGSAANLDVSVDIDTLPAGMYPDSIIITTSDPDLPTAHVSVTLDIEATNTDEITPNPFSPTTDEFVTMRFTVNGSATVRASVYDLTGEKVTELAGGEYSGSSEVTWDGKTSGGLVVADGVYFCHLKVSGASSFQKTYTIVLKK